MFNKINWKYTFASASIASILFCICAFIFINSEDYSATWILYVGSLLFFFTMAFTTVKKARGSNAGTGTMVFASLVTTFAGIILSVLICFILFMLMDRGFLFSVPANKIMEDAPPSTGYGKTGGLAFEVFFAATVLCFFGGMIAAVTLPFYVKQTQAKKK